jgi:hypothetical protein
MITILLCVCLYLYIIVRTGWNDKEPVAHKLLPLLQSQSVSRGKLAAVMVVCLHLFISNISSDEFTIEFRSMVVVGLRDTRKLQIGTIS